MLVFRALQRPLFFHSIRLMAKKYDDFDEGDSDGLFGQILNIMSTRKREFAIASVSVAVILLGIVIFGSYPKDEETAATESVPIVRANAGDYKTTPDNPGGMEIPYRDSTVFSSVDGAPNDGGTENILADENAEEPLPRDQLFAGLNTEGDQPGGAPVAGTNAPAVAPILGNPPQGELEPTQGAKVEAVVPPTNDALVQEALGTTPSDTTTTTAGVMPAEAMKATPTLEAAPPAKVEEVAKLDEPKKIEKAETVAKTEPAAGSTAAKAVTPGGFYVQLASVKDTAGAAGEYKKMQAKYTGLSGVEFRTQRADLAKGTFYRIQAGPMSKDSAASVCNGIKGQGGTCLVVAK